LATVLALRMMSQRWRAGDPLEAIVPYGPTDSGELAAAGTSREDV
jgi:hypothetical protein